MKAFSITTLLATLAAAATAPLSHAQGTAAAPSTVHVHDPASNTFWIGGPNDTINGPGPIPIDLDAAGGPWRKQLFSSPVTGFGGGGIIHETILNAGTEPWTDWHEINAQLGSHGAAWGDSSVLSMLIDGSPITFTTTVVGDTLDIDNFSQPVLPGQVLEIQKEFAATTDNFSPPNTLAFTLLEYPTTTVPEPSAMVLALMTAAGVSAARRRR